jgi:hypothetical protein
MVTSAGYKYKRIATVPELAYNKAVKYEND